MKKSIVALLVLMFFISCKTDNKKVTSSTDDAKSGKELSTILEKVALAHGFDAWSSVKKIAFTFNVDRPDSHFERGWIWHPKTNDVARISGTDTLRYNRKNMDSIALKTNGGFINDRYWLLAPFNLMWDANNFTFEHSLSEEAPMSKERLQKLTIVYGNEGGYTPGDAYDFYFGKDFLIREWVFRKGNQAEPNMITSWEDYQNFNGLQLATMHKRNGEDFKLYFTQIQAE